MLRPTGAINTLVNTAPLNCVLMDNFGIIGNSTTLDGITQTPSAPLYESKIREYRHLGRRPGFLSSERI